MGRARILLQTTIPFAEDDWNIGRFSLLAEELGRSADVVARDHAAGPGDDPVVAGLSRRDFDEVWILAVDGGIGFSPGELAALNRFHREGGGLLTARDHANMGLWLRKLDGPGAANFFHDPSAWEPDAGRHCPDDRDTPAIGFPNYHSGSNGDVQRVTCVAPSHPLVQLEGGGVVARFPSHPHEGAVLPPAGEPRARTVLRGRSAITGRSFDLVVAFDRAPAAPGRAVAHSSFHHFADYNWNPALGAPSFVSEPPSDAVRRDPRLLGDVRAYLEGCAAWLHPDAA